RLHHTRARVAAVGVGRHQLTGGRVGVDRRDDLGGRAGDGARGVRGRVDGDRVALDADAQRLVRAAGLGDRHHDAVATLVAPALGVDADAVAVAAPQEALRQTTVAVGLVRQLDDLGDLRELLRQGVDPVVQLGRRQV